MYQISFCPRSAVFLRGNVEDGLQFVFVQSRANGQALTRIDQGVKSNSGDSEVRKKIQRGGNCMDVRAEHGGVGHHVEFCGEHVVQACDGLFERAVGAHHFIVDFRHAGFDGDLHMVETCIDKLLDIFHVRETARVRVQTCDLPVVFCMSDQLWQVVSQGGFSASEDDVRHAQLPKLVNDLDPLLGAQFGEVPFAGVVAMRAVIVAAIGDRQIHAIGRGGTRAERHDGFKSKFMDGTGAIEQGLKDEG